MTWWGWIVAGAILLGAELAFVDAQFYLVFIGSAAIVTGLLSWTMPEIFEPWAQWATFGVLAIVAVQAFRGRIYRQLRGNPPAVATGPTGERIVLPAALAPGESCQVEHRGAFWTARNEGDAPIPAHGHALITRVHGLTLVVRPDA